MFIVAEISQFKRVTCLLLLHFSFNLDSSKVVSILPTPHANPFEVPETIFHQNNNLLVRTDFVAAPGGRVRLRSPWVPS